ncbi:hypothetical protein DFP73DRAFT_613307 [Morchella snyderi]|nr:hypothetical protein DFP73DRAFT_613307 [Morchella snyderi]
MVCCWLALERCIAGDGPTTSHNITNIQAAAGKSGNRNQLSLPPMATKLPFPPHAPGAKERRKRRYSRCTRNWSWTPSCPRAAFSRIPVAGRRLARRSSAAPATTGAAEAPAAEVRMAIPAIKGAMVTATVKRRLGFNAAEREAGQVGITPPGRAGDHEKGCLAAGPGPCSVTGCFGSVSTHRVRFEQMSSPTVEKPLEMRKENRRPAAPTRAKLTASAPAPAHRATFLKREVNGHGSIGRRIRPALAGLFEAGPLSPSHGPKPIRNVPRHLPPPRLNNRHVAAPPQSPVTAPQLPTSQAQEVTVPLLTREQQVLRRLDEAHRAPPVFRCVGPRNMQDYSEGELTMTYFGDPEERGECPRRAGIRNWIRGTWRSIRLVSGGEEARALVLPRGWLEEGE